MVATSGRSWTGADSESGAAGGRDPEALLSLSTGDSESPGGLRVDGLGGTSTSENMQDRREQRDPVGRAGGGHREERERERERARDTHTHTHTHTHTDREREAGALASTYSQLIRF